MDVRTGPIHPPPARESERTATAGGTEQDGDGGVRPGCGFRPFSGADEYCIRACRGRPMCRPVDGFRKETCPGGHVGPPLRGVGSVREPTEIGAGRKHSPAGRDGARPLQKERRRSRRGAPGVWLLPSKFQNGIWGVGRGHRPLRPAGGREGGTPGSSCPTGGCGEPPRLPGPAAHSGASAARSRGVGGNRSRDHPQSVQQRRTIPQSACG